MNDPTPAEAAAEGHLRAAESIQSSQKLDEILQAAQSLQDGAVVLSSESAAALALQNSRFKTYIKILSVMVAVLIVGVSVLIYRTFFVTGPQVEKTNQAVDEIKKANIAVADVQRVVDSMNDFVAKVQREQDPTLQAELYKAIFDIRKFACTRDPEICKEAGVVPLPQPTTTSRTTTTVNPEVGK